MKQTEGQNPHVIEIINSIFSRELKVLTESVRDFKFFQQRKNKVTQDGDWVQYYVTISLEMTIIS